MTPRICNDFCSDFARVRKAVIASDFGTKQGPDGADYTGISMYPVPHWYDVIAHLIGKPIVPKISCFRLNLAGELPHSWVHSDDICAQFASVLYMNEAEQCQGGTAFWRHRELGMDRLPPRQALDSRGIDSAKFYPMMDAEWKRKQMWEQYNFVPMVPNRFVTYPTYLFHSRWPWEGFGSSPADGRLIWVCFYDLQETA